MASFRCTPVLTICYKYLSIYRGVELRYVLQNKELTNIIQHIDEQVTIIKVKHQSEESEHRTGKIGGEQNKLGGGGAGG